MLEPLSRHDWVWLSVDALPEEHPALPALTDWVSQQRPFVVARTPEALAGSVNLGLTLLRDDVRQRIGFPVMLDGVVAYQSPPSLLSALPTLPEHWREALRQLHHDLSTVGMHARVYGSAAFQLLSGCPYVHADSDIDLLLDCTSPEQATKVVAVLKAYHGQPTLDGEIRFRSGWAVAWREYADALSQLGRLVLAKSNEQAALKTLADIHAG